MSINDWSQFNGWTSYTTTRNEEACCVYLMTFFVSFGLVWTSPSCFCWVMSPSGLPELLKGHVWNILHMEKHVIWSTSSIVWGSRLVKYGDSLVWHCFSAAGEQRNVFVSEVLCHRSLWRLKPDSPAEPTCIWLIDTFDAAQSLSGTEARIR